VSPAWSPDGRTIAFLRVSPNYRAEVVLTPSVVGGPERRLAEVAAPSLGYRQMRLLAWSPDGKWLVASDGRHNFGLLLLSPETGERRSLTLPPAGYDDFDPAFSPDMTRLVFVRHSGASAGDIYFLELTRELRPAGPPKRMTFDNRPMASPVWTHDGRALVFTRYLMPGRHSLWKMKLSNPPRLEPLPISADNVFGLAISPKGDRLIYTRNVNTASIWAIDSPDFQSAAGGTTAPRLLIASNREELSPAFSPNDRQIAFQSSRTGLNEIWAANRDGTHQHQLTELRGSIAGFPRWSPDGRQIVFHSRQQSYPQLFLLDLPSGRARPVTYNAVAELMPSWSRDGRWIYFGSVRGGGDEQIWKIAAQGGSPIQLTRSGGGAPLESADGKFAIYTKGDHLWRTAVTGGEEQQITTDSVAGYATAYGPVAKGIYFIRQASHADPQSLVFLSYATGQVTRIVHVPGTVSIGFTVSADERTILYTQTDRTIGDVMLVENFR
jgi:Tol biopolymer transport system component